MPTIISPLITDAGLAAAIAANGAGLQLGLTHVALGTGQYTPTNGQTTLTARKEKVTISSGLITSGGGFNINILFPSWNGIPNTYSATELGFYAGDPDAGGTLFAVYSHPSSLIVTRNSLDYVAQFSLQLSRVPTGSVNLIIDPQGAIALALLAQHNTLGNPHSQYVLKTDIIPAIQLVSAITQIMVKNVRYCFTNAAASTGTLPVAPTEGDRCYAKIMNGVTKNQLDPGVNTIEGTTGLCILDSTYGSYDLQFINGSWRFL